MYGPFPEYSVKKGQLVCIFDTMIGNTINFDASNSVHGVYCQNLAKLLLTKPRMVYFHLKVLVGDLT